MNDKKKRRMILMLVMVFAVVLIVDQLYLFGIPVGGFLGDLSAYDITGNPDIHHYMLGIVMIASVFIYMKRKKLSKMTKKRLLTIILVILFLVLPATTTAQEITDDMSMVLECPVGHRAFFLLNIYERVDFAYDNFTISEFNLNLSSNSLLNVRVSKVVRLTDYNYTFVTVWQGQGLQHNITVDDIYEEQEVFNYSRWISTFGNSTHRIETFRYLVAIPYLMVDIENVGSVDALVYVDKSYTVETFGDREVEMNVTLRDVYTTYPPYNSTYPPIVNLDPINSTAPQYYYMEAGKFQTLMIGVLGIGGCIGALVMIVIEARRKI